MRPADLQFVKRRYPILALVRELQEELYGKGAASLVQPDQERDQKTRCPMHDEGNPSAKAYVESNSIYCFVCGRTWDVPGLYASFHDVPLPRAVEELMGRLGAKPTPTDDAALEEFRRRLEPKPKEGMSLMTMHAWLDRVQAWASENALAHPYLDEVEEACEIARMTRDPAECEEVVTSVRHVIAWARHVASHHYGRDLPPPQVEAAEYRALIGMA